MNSDTLGRVSAIFILTLTKKDLSVLIKRVKIKGLCPGTKKAVGNNEADVIKAGFECVATGPYKTYRAESLVCLWPCMVGPIE